MEPVPIRLGIAVLLALVLAGAGMASFHFVNRHRLEASPALLGIPGIEDSEPSMDAQKAQIRQLLAQDDYAAIESLLQKSIDNYKQGRISDIALRNLFFVFEDTDPGLEKRYDAWWGQYPRSYSVHLARGIYFRSLAQERRGDKFIQETPVENIDEMEDMLGRAFRELQSSLNLDDKPVLTYQYLISSAKHVKKREYLRRQLDASLQIDPKNFVVRRVYLRALRPRWGGSIGQMQAFVQECRAAGLPPAQISELEALVEEELAWVAEQDQQFPLAIQHYANAVRAFPHSNDDLWLDYARVTKEHADCATALPVFTHLTERGDQLKTYRAWVHSNRAWCLGRLNHQQEAYEEIRIAAELGDPWAQTELGEVLYHGGVVPANRAEAAEWFRKAADQGDETARKRVAGIHDHP